MRFKYCTIQALTSTQAKKFIQQKENRVQKYPTKLIASIPKLASPGATGSRCTTPRNRKLKANCAHSVEKLAVPPSSSAVSQTMKDSPIALLQPKKQQNLHGCG